MPCAPDAVRMPALVSPLMPPPPPPPPPQLADRDFECLFVSPLKRTVQTADVVWGGRKAPVMQLPSLREIDLYSFQVGGLNPQQRQEGCAHCPAALGSTKKMGTACTAWCALAPLQGLDKLENRSLYPEQYASWQSNPSEFRIDGHAPVGGWLGGWVGSCAWWAVNLWCAFG